MKKLISAVLVIVISVLTLVGCGEKKESLPVKDIFAKINTEVSFPSPMMEMDAEYTENQFGFNLDDFEEYVFAKSEDILLAEYVIIFKAKEEKNAENVKDKLEKFLAEQTNLFASYVPEQKAILENGFVEKKGCYVYLVSSEKVNEVKKILNDSIR